MNIETDLRVIYFLFTALCLLLVIMHIADAHRMRDAENEISQLRKDLSLERDRHEIEEMKVIQNAVLLGEVQQTSMSLKRCSLPYNDETCSDCVTGTDHEKSLGDCTGALMLRAAKLLDKFEEVIKHG